VISCVVLALYLPPTSWWRFVKWFIAGIIFYALYGYRHSRLRGGGPPPPAAGIHDFNPESQLPDTDV
jgi:hypothetical protein